MRILYACPRCYILESHVLPRLLARVLDNPISTYNHYLICVITYRLGWWLLLAGSRFRALTKIFGCWSRRQDWVITFPMWPVGLSSMASDRRRDLIPFCTGSHVYYSLPIIITAKVQNIAETFLYWYILFIS